MKFLMPIVLLFFATTAKAQQDTISLNEGNFHVAYSPSLKYPVKVYWHLTAADLNCATPLARSNKFIADPQVTGTNFKKDYSKSGYDQGHNFDAKDDACNLELNAHCWYFTNMAPQTPNLNRIVWRALEDQCRKWAAAGDDLFIVCGSVGCATTIGTDRVAVPYYCWKVITHKNGQIEAYAMPNVPEVKDYDYSCYKVDVSQLPVR